MPRTPPAVYASVVTFYFTYSPPSRPPDVRGRPPDHTTCPVSAPPPPAPPSASSPCAAPGSRACCGSQTRGGPPEWPKAVESAALEAARSSSRGSGWAPNGRASPLGVTSQPELPGVSSPNDAQGGEVGPRQRGAVTMLPHPAVCQFAVRKHDVSGRQQELRGRA